MTNEPRIPQPHVSSEHLLDALKFLLPGEFATILVEAFFLLCTYDCEDQVEQLKATIAYPYSTAHGSPRTVLNYVKLVEEFNNGADPFFQEGMEQLLMAALNATIKIFGLSAVSVHQLEVGDPVFFGDRNGIEYAIKAVVSRSE